MKDSKRTAAAAAAAALSSSSVHSFNRVYTRNDGPAASLRPSVLPSVFRQRTITAVAAAAAVRPRPPIIIIIIVLLFD